MSFSVEVMLSERAKIGVSLMISLTVNAFKRVRAQFPLFYFKSRQVDFEICLATSCEIMVVFALMRTVTCYDSMPKVLSKELTLVLSDTRELNRVLSTE